MRIRSYFSGTVEAAMERARVELGDNALLLEVREAPAEARSFGAYEVVLGAEAESAEPCPPLTIDTRARVQGELGAFLVERDLAPSVASGIETEIELAAGAKPVTEGDLRQAVESRLRSAPPLPAEPPILALTGPAGAGKTSTAVKLALRLTQRYRRAALIIDADCRRVGAGAFLARLCELAGLAREAAPAPRALEFLAAHAPSRPILIDLPGFAPGETAELEDWAAAIAPVRAIQVLLTLNATAQAADCLAAAQRFRVFDPSGLVATHWDETRSAGGVVSTAAVTGLPIRWLATGPSIPEDLREASPELLANRLLGLDERAETQTAAATAGY